MLWDGCDNFWHLHHRRELRLRLLQLIPFLLGSAPLKPCAEWCEMIFDAIEPFPSHAMREEK